MMRHVHPHDLLRACKACGMTVDEVSARTGIPVHELLSFAKGHVALCARDRLAIIATLTGLYPTPPSPVVEVAPLDEVEDTTVNGFDAVIRELCEELREWRGESLRILCDECLEENRHEEQV